MLYSVLKRLLRCIGLFTVGRTENDRAVGKCCDIKLRSVPLLPQAAIESSSDAGMPLASNTPPVCAAVQGCFSLASRVSKYCTYCKYFVQVWGSGRLGRKRQRSGASTSGRYAFGVAPPHAWANRSRGSQGV